MTIAITKAQVTAAKARLHHRIGIGQRRQRIPRQQYPKLVESDYAKGIVRVLQRTHQVLRPVFAELPALVASAQRDRMDAGEGNRLRELMERARRAVDGAVQPSEVETLARMFAERTSTFQRVQLGRQVRAALGADVFASDRRIPTLVEHFVSENASLITTIPRDQLNRVEKLTSRAFTGGMTPDELTAELDRGFDISERHARLIARDQIGKLNGQTNAYRQQDLGIESFIWRTAGDERVREEHQRLDGRTFRWDDPPDEGLPGEPIQCRCYGEPVLGPIVDEVTE